MMWQCFHCDEVFTDRAAAAAHFGPSIYSDPACAIDAHRLRELEAELARYREEDTDLHRELYGMQSKHQTELRRAEEEGYARGLHDVPVGLYEAIAHGDEQHRAWLKRTLEEYCAGYRLSEPRRIADGDVEYQSWIDVLRAKTSAPTTKVVYGDDGYAIVPDVLVSLNGRVLPRELWHRHGVTNTDLLDVRSGTYTTKYVNAGVLKVHYWPHLPRL